MRQRALAALILLAWPVMGQAQDAPAPPPKPEHEAQRPGEKPTPPVTQQAAPEAKPDAPAVQPTKPEDPAPAAPKAPAPQDAAPADGVPMHQQLHEDDFSYSACLLDLSIIGAEYSPEPPITDPDQRDCGIDRPIKLTSPLPGITIPGGAVMRCQTAWHLAHWLSDFVRPAAAMLPGQPRLATLEPGSTYQCRATVGNAGEKLSEHAFGNAFDLAAFGFSDGTRIEIAPRQDEGDLTEAFQRAVRGAACLHFTTVLGPGSNAAHDNHLHLDIKARKGGWRLCQ